MGAPADSRSNERIAAADLGDFIKGKGVAGTVTLHEPCKVIQVTGNRDLSIPPTGSFLPRSA